MFPADDVIWFNLGQPLGESYKEELLLYLILFIDCSTFVLPVTSSKT